MIKVMLDTNICIYIIKQKPKTIMQHFKQYQFKEIAISSIVYAELLYGVYSSQLIEKNRVALSEFTTPLTIMEFDQDAAQEYGMIRAQLTKQGNLIGGNDLFIAAHARSLSIPIITNNVREFERVEGLIVQAWN